MANILNADDGAISGSAGIKLSSDTSGVLNIQTNGVTAISIAANQVVSFPATVGINFNGQIQFEAGTALIPAISTVADTNTGIFFPAADTIAFTEGGVESMRIDASGNMGLGVTPSAWGASVKAIQINAQGSIASTGNLIYVKSNNYFDGATDRYIASSTASDYYQNAGQHIWRTAASGTAGNAISWTQAMTLDASGNLGVGSTTPYAPGGANQKSIELAGASYGTLYTSANSRTVIGFFSAENPDSAIKTGSATNHPLLLLTNSTERARITSGGDLLLGTTTASGKLTVSGTGWAHFVSNAASSSPSATDPFGIWLGSNRSNGDTEGNIAYRNYLTIASWDGTTYSERARIDSAGNFMVGATSALGRATIVQGASSNADTLILKSPNAAGAGSQPGIQFLRDTNAVLAQFFADTNTGALLTFVNGSERTRITSGGNVGIATSSPSYLLDIGDSPNNSTFIRARGGLLVRRYRFSESLTGSVTLRFTITMRNLEFTNFFLDFSSHKYDNGGVWESRRFAFQFMCEGATIRLNQRMTNYEYGASVGGTVFTVGNPPSWTYVSGQTYYFDITVAQYYVSYATITAEGPGISDATLAVV